MNNRKQVYWNRPLFSAASLVLWCQAAGRFGLIIDQIAFPSLIAKEIYPIGWGMIISSACLITKTQVPIGQLLRPTTRTVRGLIACWPELLTLGIEFFMFGGVVIEREMLITLAGGVLCEETVFRMMFCSFCLRKNPSLDPKTIVFVSSVLWGSAHLLNVLAGTPLIMAVWQCISAIGIGLMLGIIFLQTRSVWPMVLVHFAHNLVNMTINTDRLTALVAHGGFSWKTRLAMTVWLRIWGTWLWVMWTVTELKEVEAV